MLLKYTHMCFTDTEIQFSFEFWLKRILKWKNYKKQINNKKILSLIK